MLYQLAYHIIAPVIIKPFLKLFNRMVYSGFDKIPADGGAVVIANHISMWDPVIMFCMIRRRAYFMGKSELFRIPVLGPFLRRIGVFPVNRDAIDRAALKKSAQVLSEGNVLVIFPEGHRSKTGELLPFKEGAAYFAHRAGVPVIPVSFDNTRKIFPAGVGQKVRVTCGEPLDMTAFRGKKADSALLEEMTNVFKDGIEKMLKSA